VNPELDHTFKRRIEPRWSRTKLRDLNWSDIATWANGLRSLKGSGLAPKGELAGQLAEGSKRLILARFSSLLEYGIEIGALGSNPCKQIPAKRRPRQGEARRRILSPDEEKRLLAKCETRPWLAEVIVVALSQALRLGEVLALRVEDVDFTANRLRVHHAFNQHMADGGTKHSKLTKRRDPRDTTPIPLMPAAREVLLARRMKVGSGYLFTNSIGRPRTRWDVQRGYSQAVENACLPETAEGSVNFHSLRHTGISRLANHPGVPLVHVRDFAGHTDLATTQSYVHKIENEKVTEAMREALG
jgi:integrase